MQITKLRHNILYIKYGVNFAQTKTIKTANTRTRQFTAYAQQKIKLQY